MKRFYETVTTKAEEGGLAILLDGRPVRTPARQSLLLPTEALAGAIAGEWMAQGARIDPLTMPFTGLANAAIDRIAADPAAFARDLARYAETDLLCYRADSPSALVERQAAAWDPLLDWARARYDIAFIITAGVIHVTQAEATVRRLAEAVAARDAFSLAALSPLVTISGSLVIALALAEGAIASEDAFAAAHLDELWQAEQWGEDTLAARARAARASDFMAAARFLALLAEAALPRPRRAPASPGNR